jgi:hypothetical protein
MELLKKNKHYAFIGITGLFSFLSYFLWRRLRKNSISANFVNRLREIKVKYDAIPNRQLNEEVSFTLMNILQDISDYFYFRDYSHEENLRSACLDYPEHEEEYENLCFETMQLQHECMERAKVVLTNYTGVTFTKINEFLKNNRDGNYRDLINKYRIRKEDVPNLQREKAKEAYIFYADETYRFTILSIQAQNNNNPAAQQEYVRFFIVNQLKVKDRLLEKYSVEERYLLDLLDIHNLREDPEIMQRINRMKALEEMRSNRNQAEMGDPQNHEN